VINNALARAENEFAAKHKPAALEQLRPFIVKE